MLSQRVSQTKNQKFEEIDVERINVVEKDGKVKMVISNAARQHPGAVDGKLIPREQGRAAGMIFFNERGYRYQSPLRAHRRYNFSMTKGV